MSFADRVLTALRADSQAMLSDLQLAKALGNVEPSKLGHHLLLLQDEGLVAKTATSGWRLTWAGHDRAEARSNA
ncbi:MULTISPECIES: hypothetical protein [Cupriavidus]